MNEITKGIVQEIRHTSVKMTEKYADFELSKLRHDLPTLLNMLKESKFGKWDTILWDTERPRDTK